MSEQKRAYLYRISAPLLALLTFYGAVSEEAAPLWLALVVAALAGGPSALAARHTSIDADD